MKAGVCNCHSSGGTVELAIFDPSGRLIKRLLDHEQKEAGIYQLPYQHQAGSGVFFARFVCGNEIRTQKIVVLK